MATIMLKEWLKGREIHYYSITHRINLKRMLVLLSFSFGHCVVCPIIYGFWLPPLVSSSSSSKRLRSPFQLILDKLREVETIYFIKFKGNTYVPPSRICDLSLFLLSYFSPLVFLITKLCNYLAFQYFDLKRTWT